MTLTIKNVKPKFLSEFERFAESLNATMTLPITEFERTAKSLNSTRTKTTLTIKNVKPKFLSEFERFAENLNATIANATIAAPKQDECEICKAHNYTLNPKVEQEILRSMAELENERKNGTLKTYTSIDELRKALEA